MASSNITIRMDEELKRQAEELFSNLGLNMTAAFTIFAKQAIREQAIPFKISMENYNADTITAIENVLNKKNLSRAFSSVEELMGELNADD